MRVIYRVINVLLISLLLSLSSPPSLPLSPSPAFLSLAPSLLSLFFYKTSEWLDDPVQQEEGKVQEGWLLLEEEERWEDHAGGSHEAQSPRSGGKERGREEEMEGWMGPGPTWTRQSRLTLRCLPLAVRERASYMLKLGPSPAISQEPRRAGKHAAQQ